jgi:hypothetical protein
MVACGERCAGSFSADAAGPDALFPAGWSTKVNSLPIFSGWWSWVWIFAGLALVAWWLSGNANLTT